MNAMEKRAKEEERSPGVGGMAASKSGGFDIKRLMETPGGLKSITKSQIQAIKERRKRKKK